MKKSSKNEMLTMEEITNKYPNLDVDITASPEQVENGVHEYIKYINDEKYRNKEIHKRLNKIL